MTAVFRTDVATQATGGGPDSSWVREEVSVKAQLDEAFGLFVAARSRHLLQTAYLLTGDRHRAEDLLQTALTKAYLRWDRISSDDPEGYVRRILANAHIDWWRKRSSREQPTETLPETAEADRSAEVEVRDAVLTALAELPRRQRAVVVLRYFEDLSEAEIAQTLGCSPGTVKSAASRAMAKLREDPGIRAQREEFA
jgi:RNA polymerase sigma-70 factor (sigma-E family)